MTQLVELPTLGSGHCLMVHEMEPRIGLCADKASLEFCLPFFLPLSCSYALKINKLKKMFLKKAKSTLKE